MNKKEKNQLIYNDKKKNVITATALSLMIVGGGQVYNGEIGKGVLMFVACCLMWLFMMGWIWWIIAPIEANHAAKRHNRLLRLDLDLED